MAIKVRENRLRRVAERMGFVLIKSHSRDPEALDFGRYQVRDRNGSTFAGVGPGWRPAFDLEQVEEWLTGDQPRAARELQRLQPLMAARATYIEGNPDLQEIAQMVLKAQDPTQHWPHFLIRKWVEQAGDSNPVDTAHGELVMAAGRALLVRFPPE
jgi:hypothetical protein